MWPNVILALGAIVFPDTILGANYPQPTCYEKTTQISSCLDKYAAMPGHMNCRYPATGKPVSILDEADIVHIHNNLRSNVRPFAANMMELEYTTGLQSTAKRWTRLCTVDSNWFERTTPGAYISGQNTFVSPTNVPWKGVLNVWIAENTSFTLGVSNNALRVGNYTQMISANTTAMGCAVSDCSRDGLGFLYMCLYIPILDTEKIDNPYTEGGKPCEGCMTNCNTSANLCNCNGVTCLGGSTLNLTTCGCECIADMGNPDMYNGTLCDLTCNDPDGDDPACGKPPYTKDSCDTNIATMFHCPYMCYMCPYAGKSYPNGAELLPWDKGLPNCTTTTSTTTSTTTPTPLAISPTASLSGGSAGGTITPSGSLNSSTGSTVSVGYGDGGKGGVNGTGGPNGSGNGTGAGGKAGGGNGNGSGGSIVPISSTTSNGITNASVSSGDKTSLFGNTSVGGNSAQPTGRPGSNPGAFGWNAGQRNSMPIFWSVCSLIVSTVLVCM